MERPTVVVDKEEYGNLMAMKGKLIAFKDYVLATEFSVDRKICAAILGFELQEQVNEDAGTDREQDGCRKICTKVQNSLCM